MARRIKARHQLWLGSLAIFTLVAFTTIPGMAAPSTVTKIYSVNVTPTNSAGNSTAIAGVSGQVFKVRFSNLTPGNSSFKSFLFNAPTGFTVSDARVAPKGTDSSNSNNSAVVAWSTGCHIGSSSTTTSCPTVTGSNIVTLTGLDPITSTNTQHQFVTIVVTVTTPALSGTACSGSFGTWAQPAEWTSNPGPTVVYTGSNLSGDLFTQQASTTTGTMTDLVGCLSLVWGQKPTNAVVNTDISPSPTVNVVDANNNPVSVSGATVTISIDGTAPSGAVLNNNTATLSSGVATFPHLQGTKVGDYTVHATAPSFTSSPDASFTLFEYGDLGCGDPLNVEGVVGGRGTYNKNGSSCTKVDYTVDKSNIVSGQFGVTWDTTADPYAALKYMPPWQPEPFPSSGQLSQLQTAWYSDTNGLVWHFATACSSDQLPSPYGTVATTIDPSAGSVSIDTTTGVIPLPHAPFAIVIGTERLWVTSVTGNTLTFGDSNDQGLDVRGDGGTAPDQHLAGAKIMSTPLTIDPNSNLVNGNHNPEFGDVVPVCIANDGWAPAGYDSNGDLLIQRTTEVIDIGDSFTRK